MPATVVPGHHSPNTEHVEIPHTSARYCGMLEVKTEVLRNDSCTSGSPTGESLREANPLCLRGVYPFAREIRLSISCVRRGQTGFHEHILRSARAQGIVTLVQTMSCNVFVCCGAWLLSTDEELTGICHKIALKMRAEGTM